MKKLIPIYIIFIISLISSLSFAQVSFPGNFSLSLKDKNNSTYSFDNPSDYLSRRAIVRRQKQNIKLDSSDLPVNTFYLSTLSNYGLVKYTSRWQNSVLMRIEDSLSYVFISNLNFVKNLEYLSPASGSAKTKRVNKLIAKANKNDNSFEYIEHGKSQRQIDIINLLPLHNEGNIGSGILITVLDAGFNNVNNMKAFERLRSRNGIIVAKDFVMPGNNVYNEFTHGCYVLSTIAGDITSSYYGTAPQADFILLRTEDVNSEFPIEEYYWLIGAEFADSAGSDIISSSLGYNQFDDSTLNHNWAQLDGKTTIVSKAATMAFSKGMVVINSAGNDGEIAWRKIGFPADAIGIISVGAIDSLGKYASFSSVGNSSDGRIKPEIVAVGKSTALVSTADKIFYGNGTSFSTPTIAGAIASLMQANPSASAENIRKAVLMSANNFNNPDSLTGYGIPNFFVANLILKSINIDTSSKELSFKSYPNPFSTGFYLVFSSPENQFVSVSLADLSGKMIWGKSIQINTGAQAFYFSDFQNINNGIYFLIINTNQKVYTTKIIKQN